MTRYLLDTNVVSELRRVKPHGAVLAWLNSLRVDQILLSAITIGELQTGVELTRKSNPQKAIEIENWLDQIESSFAVLPMDSRCFREWAKIMQHKPPQISEDGMIAATAKIHGLVIATRNETDFQQFVTPIFNPFKYAG